MSSKRFRNGSPRDSASASWIIGWSSTASPSTAIAERQAWLTPTAALRIAGLIGLFLLCAPIHIATKLVLRHSPWPRRFLAGAAWIIGARVQVRGGPVLRHSLLVSNHLSWMDILVLGGSLNSAFVSKDKLGHPFVHWLADQNATVYVRRSHVKGAKDQAIALARSLEREKPVTVFAEGTTGPGTHLLPFRSTLLEAANFAARDVEVRPVAIDYGPAMAEIAWFHEPGTDNVLRLLGRAGTLPVTVHILDPLDRSGDRKQLAHQSREAIGQMLGFKLLAGSPIGSGE